jgi:hypothetical protein
MYAFSIMHLLPVEDREILSFLEEIRDRLETLGLLQRERTDKGEKLTASFEGYKLFVERNFCDRYVSFKLFMSDEILCDITVNVEFRLIPTVYVKPLYFMRPEELKQKLEEVLRNLDSKVVS